MTTKWLQTKELNDLIHTIKGQYYTQITKKLMEPTTSAKNYLALYLIA